MPRLQFCETMSRAIIQGSVAMLLLVLTGCVTSRPPAPAPAPVSTGTGVTESTLAAERLFDFHVGFWVNLHQRLYAESGSRPPRDPLHATAASDQEVWNHAVELYRRRYVDRGFLTLLENEELVRTNRRLAPAETSSDLASADLPADLRAALEEAAPVYRQHRWPVDERAGHEFRDRLAPLLARSGSPMARALARAYETPWPNAPIRVDIAAFAGPVGAYTMLDPTHITIASGDRRHIGDAALEILFHEASHSLVRRIEESIARACRAQGKQIPSTLWHEVLFYSTGELTRRQLGPSYTPYAYQNGLYERNQEWKGVEPLLVQHWPAYLDGRQSLDATIDRLVAGLP